MSLRIVVRNAINLPNKDSLGKSDPYVSACFQGDKKKTEVKSGTLDPVWDEELTWTVGAKPPRVDESIEIIVKDYERIGWNKILGKTHIPLRNLLHGTSGPIELDQTLLDENDQPTSGKLSMSIQYTPLLGTQATATAGKATSSNAAAKSAASTGDFADGVATGDFVATDTVGFSGGMPTAGKQALQRTRETLSNVKTKFQIRVRIVEARQLLGEDLCPICHVTLGNHIQQTKVHKSVVSPWFNELFFFYEEAFPKDVMAQFIEFKICNSRVFRSESIIGAFKCEVSQVYDQFDHAIINKWLVLAHPEEPTPTIQGYLKVSIAIIGPGDVCPNMDPSTDGSDDVEENLLWSAGVHLQPASFTLSIYCAENLPRMDSGTMQTLKEILGFGKASKELVDPYIIASYAGREVQTRVLYTNDNPEFKQEIHIGFLFPSMCNTLKVTLMDWDRVGHDDVIGVVTIPIDSISAPGEDGYLPSFGPTHVPVYGARREWELWEGKTSPLMNQGVEKGCSYRGRILLSMKTNIGTYPPLPTTDMDEMAYNKVRRFRSTRSFVVVAHLTHAYLLKEANRPLEVEISMGNFGNKLECSLLPSPSSTHPSNPIFDGCKYYFLPWGDSVPLIMIQCQFEDISHRLFCSNAISSIVQELKGDLTKIKSFNRARRTNADDSELMKLLQETLKKLDSNCKKPLPYPDPIRHVETSLDIALLKRRRKTLDKISQNLQELIKCEDSKSVLEELENLLIKLENLCPEPQNSMPDVFLWLMSGTERLAFARISAQDILFSYEQSYSGKKCGKFNTFTLQYPEDDTGTSIGGVLRASLWLGREEELISWWADREDLQLTVYAETYENQVITAPGTGKWTNKGALMRRPSYSDADGLKELPMQTFAPSPGWKFQGDWFIDPDPSIKFTNDAGHTVYCEEVFQQQARVPGGTWIDAPTTWADVRGDPATPRDDVESPVGWQWRDIWTTDLQRAVDSEGWEYTVQKGITGWSPQEKLYHVLRRRRWIRERHRVGKVEQETLALDGWEYSTLFGSRFHGRERAIDIVRRRRWRRRLVPSNEGLPPTPRVMVKSDDGKDAVIHITCPRQYVVSTELHKYQLRAHIYQARDLEPGDKTGFSDPYAVITFCGSTQQTEKQNQTLCPTWDQTIVFDEVKISGPLIPPNDMCPPPTVAVEIYDWDARGEPDFHGRVMCDPQVINPSDGYKPPKLQWYQLQKGKFIQGELLAAFELLLKSTDDLPMPPPSKGDLFMVPFGIRPLLQKTRIEILCWGVRNMATYELQSVTRPSIEFECGGQSVKSSIMKNARHNPNFDDPHLVFDVELPKEELYVPPLTLRVIDHRSFGSKPVVASAVVTDLHKYNVEPKAARRRAELTHTHSLVVRLSKKEKHASKATFLSLSPTQASFEPGIVDREIDWWAKYYASTNDLQRCGSYLKKGYERLEIITGNLEDDPRFHSFTDLVDTIPLSRGKSDDSTMVGEFKGTFRLYAIPSETDHLPLVLEGFPSPDTQEVLARIYVISAKDLAPKDGGSSSDPYVVISLGRQVKNGKEHYRAGTLNPIFGRMYELKGTLPLVKDLVIQVWDRDTLSADDLIGETSIDLENRFLSRHRAWVGLPKQYHVSGPNIWRDFKVPSQILQETAKLRHLEGPAYSDDMTSLTLGGALYSLSDFEPKVSVLPPTLGCEKERLSLHVLNSVMTLVPEYIESRTLYHSERPDLPQGTVQLWVDLFPSGVSIPPPIDISPRTPTKFILRVCVYNAYEVPLQESNMAGEKMSDVYVKGWLQGSDEVQKTDIHYRCLEGEANFNWRMVHHFDFLEAEQMMVVKKKTSLFTSEEAEERRPPYLTMQLWDNDLISRDDYLSEMNVNLCRFPKPAKSLSKVVAYSIPTEAVNGGVSPNGLFTTLLMPSDDEEPVFVNLFEVKRVYGYFPFVRTSENGIQETAGKLEAEFEVLTEEEAQQRPAGQGRDKPNSNPVLLEPNRPATSFFWLSSPWKSCRHVVWKNYKWHILIFAILILSFLFVFLFIYSLPAATIDLVLGTY